MKKLILILLSFLLLPGLAFSWGEEEDVGTITGRLMLKNGKPMSDAMVFLFDANTGPAPMLGKFWRVPDVISGTDDAGKFTIQTKQGKYYLGAIKRMSDVNPMGPPVSGDYVYPSFDEEVKGKFSLHRIVKWETTTIGTIKGIIPFDKSRHMYKGPVTAIEGTITLEDGTPAVGAIVFAYDNAGMNGNPSYASDPAEADGKYVLRIGKSGTYYLRVRGVYGGGQPASGSLMGGGSPAGVKISIGTSVKGVNITGSTFVNRGEVVK